MDSLARPHDARTITFAGESYLDLVRALAANAVVINHAFLLGIRELQFPLAMFGVSVFFLLSGFLIFISACRHLRLPRQQFAAFCLDRTARIFVPFIPALLLAVALNAALPLPKVGQPGTATGGLAFLGNLLLLNEYPGFQVIKNLTGSHAFYIRSYNGAEPFWTIPVEYWTYIAFALGFFGLARKLPKRPLALSGLALVSVPVVVYNAFAGPAASLTVIWALGAIFGFLWTNIPHQSRQLRKAAFGMICFGIAGMAGRCWKVGLVGYDVQLIIFLALILFGAFFVANQLRPPRFFTSFTGFAASYSYSLYLTHNIAILVVVWFWPDMPVLPRLIWSVLVAHVVAYLMYLAVERHYRDVARTLKDRLLGRDAAASSPPAATLASPGPVFPRGDTPDGPQPARGREGLGGPAPAWPRTPPLRRGGGMNRG